jgi:hypothetical protein
VTAVNPHEAQLALDQLKGRDTLCSASEAATFAEQLVELSTRRARSTTHAHTSAA